MRPFALVSPALFWAEHVGRQLRTLGRDYQLLALYLWTAPASNPYGLYYLSFDQLLAEAGYTPAIATRVLDTLGNLEFAYYHQTEQWVWVKSLAQHALMPTGKLIPQTDNRIKGLHRWYADVPDNPYLGPFFDYYRTTFYLPERREWSRPADVQVVSVEPVATSALPAARRSVLPAAPREPSLFSDEPAAALVPVARRTAIARRRTNGADYDPLFLEWFAAYPSHRRVDKRHAYQEWLKLRPAPDRAWLDAALAVLDRQKKTRDWLKEGGKFVPMPGNYLKRGKFEDEVREHRFIPEADVDRAVTSYEWGTRRDDDDPE